jgi:Transposase DDE domain group 1
MPTHCRPDSLDFGSVEGRSIVAAFDGGQITSDGGAVLLAKTNAAIRLIDRAAAAFADRRNPDLIEHEVETLVGQRIIGEALGYPDLNDHDRLRHDPLLASILGKLTARDKRCAPLAGKSTLNRLEHSPQEGEARAPHRYHKISHDGAAIDRLLLDIFKEAEDAEHGQHRKGKKSKRRVFVLDPDATDVPLHGHQEGRHFHGHYDCYCYLPLYIFCNRHLLTARLRPSSIDGASGITEEIARITAFIRAHWPDALIVVRADSGFCRDELMTWCEANDVHYVIGLAKNPRINAAIKPELAEAETEHKATRRPARRFKDLVYQTHDSWTQPRRVVAKAEWTEGEANPRFIVTSLTEDVMDARALYEDFYCKRGEMENRIKETQTDLFGDHMPATTMRANQLRLTFSALAYVLICALRRIALAGTKLEKATCATIRLCLLKIGAQITVSVRRVKVALATGCPWRDLFETAHQRLCAYRC